jgi:hypothetical protein
MLTHVFVICSKSYCILLRVPAKRVMCYRRDRLRGMLRIRLSCASSQPSSVATGGEFDDDEGQQEQQTDTSTRCSISAAYELQ